MTLAIVTGSGAHALPGMSVTETIPVTTRYGTAEVTRGTLAETEVLQLSRHGAGHARLSHQVAHRANIAALHELGATAVVGCTACGAADRTLELGSLVVFDDLHFPSNRLPSGELCTFFDTPGEAGRGHWVLHGGPFSPELRATLVAAAREAGHDPVDGGTYGHVDGPRFNTPSEIAALRACGVTAVSQTGGPEAVLCGELELPFALIGFITDHANEVRPGATTPVSVLQELIGRSPRLFAATVGATARRLAAPGAATPAAAGTMLRFGGV